jgi:hypothetical protein
MRGVLLICALAANAWAQPQINPHSLVLEDFTKRVAEYVKLHKTVEAKLPKLKPTPEPEKIAHHEHELAEDIRHARREAAPGAIFTPDISAEFRRLIGIAMQGSEAARVQESLKHAEPVRFRLRVNEPYPAGVPQQTTPPSLLLNLPELPPEVGYRVVDHDLVLLDLKANLVVDFMIKAIP